MKFMTLSAISLPVFLGLASSLSQAQAQLPWGDRFVHGSPEQVGISAERLQASTDGLQDFIDRGEIAGAVAAVIKDGRLVYAQALGLQDRDNEVPMTVDSLFRTYSMTRPVTALGIIMLHDRGLLNVNDPLIKYLPEFGNQRVLSNAGSMDVKASRERRGEITLAQLLTHTSGIGSRSSALYRQYNVHRYDQTLEQVVDNVAALPLFEDPGTAYRYGMHAEILGRVIEQVSGMEIDAFFEQWIFEPLKMTDTVFYVDEQRAARLATVYRKDDAGSLRAHEMENIPVTNRRALKSAGVGLVSSTADFLRFSLMLLNEGRIDGQQIISAEAAQMMAVNAVPDELLPLGGSGYWAGSGWSLGGMAVVMDPSAYNHTVSPGEYWWDGSAGTRYWIDPVENMITIIMAQVSPASGGGFREQFKTDVYESLQRQ
ncbi:serine hydrolase domain-containing protein [Pseudohongiella spirulinae]|uniref:Beta-lactamase n=1 Tax=Pseudohongiella spirulinae TaxID=1249552 RepID=A0A0S2KCE7_9GAMM|nr:serine hydrolase domain-containing protein [Pseudohongiella spirulinae]ALO45602.1 Beta-lactamase [Pseudohongiella spirulinae]